MPQTSKDVKMHYSHPTKQSEMTNEVKKRTLKILFNLIEDFLLHLQRRGETFSWMLSYFLPLTNSTCNFDLCKEKHFLKG